MPCFIHLQNSLKFPDDLTISDDAKDLIRKLLSDRKGRIGYEGLANHNFFKGLDWTTLKDGEQFFFFNLRYFHGCNYTSRLVP